MASAAFTNLTDKLDAFIRKHYRNQLIRGGLYALTFLLFLFLSISILEFFGHYGTVVRGTLFYGSLAIAMGIIWKFIWIPLSGLARIGKVMDYDTASRIIGDHFPEVSDRLLNTLQLYRLARTSADEPLLMAAIEQKTRLLQPIPFLTAINLRQNLRYARLAALPLLAGIIIYLVAPGMIADGTLRVLHHNQTFAVPPPFTFVIGNPHLEAEQYKDFTLEVNVHGKEIPDQVFINRNGTSIRMQKTNEGHFIYTFSSVREHIPFVLEAAGFSSGTYELKVQQRPQMLGYMAAVRYPDYLHRPQEYLENPGDLSLPAGTQVAWTFMTRQTDGISIRSSHRNEQAIKTDATHFTWTSKFFQNQLLTITQRNDAGRLSDSMQWTIEVIPDAYPMISVEEIPDSNEILQRYFIGDVSDDHGISRIMFHAHYLTKSGATEPREPVNKPVPVNLSGKQARFHYEAWLKELGIQPGDELEYYFEAWDNDGVNGPKSVRSRVMTYRAASEKELAAENDVQKKALKEAMESSIRDAKKLQQDMKAMEQKLLEKRELSWEEKQKLEQLLNRQKNLEKKIADIKKEQQEIAHREEEYRQQSQEIMNKQKELDKLFNEIMDEEMKKLINQTEMLMQQQNKEQIRKELQQLELTNKDVEKELDKMLEHYKQLEVEKQLEESVQKLEQLSEKQENLAKKTDELAKDKQLNKAEKKEQGEQLRKEQERLNQQFKDIQQQLNKTEELNKALEQPKELKDTKPQQEQIQKKQEESMDQLKKEDPKESSESQKEAADQMKEMKDKMKEGMEEAEEEEEELNATALREILGNTIQLSEDQEKLMEDFKQVTNYNPQYVAIAKEQKTIRDNARIIEDSLTALGKRMPELRSFVNKEVTRLNDNLDRSVEGFSSRNIGGIRLAQQQAMMNANNLGVMLSEILKQVQDEQQKKDSGKQGGKPKKGGKPGKSAGQGKPGKGKSMSELKKMQEELNKQLREGMNKQSGKGNKPGEPGMGSQEYARMAAQQMAIRQQMQKMLNQMGTKEKEGMGGNGKLQELQRMMEQTEKELFNKRLSNEMINRQEEIMTRMLESEKAEKKQEQDNKREAEQAKEKPRTAPPSFDQYIRKKKAEEELLQTIPAEMQPYYKEKSTQYLNKSSQ